MLLIPVCLRPLKDDYIFVYWILNLVEGAWIHDYPSACDSCFSVNKQ